MAREKRAEVKAVFDVGGEDNLRSVKIGANTLITNVNEDTKKIQEFTQIVKSFNTSVSVKIGKDQNQVVDSFCNKNEYLAEALLNSAIQPCIEAYQSNIAFVDWGLKPKIKDLKQDDANVKADQIRLNNLIEYPNTEDTIQDVIEKLIYDAEAAGVLNVEVLRNTKNEIVGYKHIPCNEITRIEDKDAPVVEVTEKYFDAEDKLIEKPVSRSFDKFIIKYGNKQRFCKEFGDPRLISKVDGKVLADKVSLANAKLFTKSATEIIQIYDYYGYRNMAVPRWLSQMSFVKGLRHAQAVNLDFFENNGIPAMIITVSGGRVDEKYISKVKKMFEGKNGLKSNVRVAIIEAQGEITSSGSGIATGVSQPQLGIHNLMKDRSSDIIFEKFLNISRESIQSAFRIPDIHVGRNTDYTQSTAETSLLMTEDNVFKPLRKKYASIFNNFIFRDSNGLKSKYWELVGSPPALVLNIRRKAAFQSMSDSDALTPNMSIELNNKIHDVNFDKIQHKWGDYPMIILRIFASKSQVTIDEFMNSLQGLEVKEQVKSNG